MHEERGEGNFYVNNCCEWGFFEDGRGEFLSFIFFGGIAFHIL
jgi:hypothetical protein